MLTALTKKTWVTELVRVDEFSGSLVLFCIWGFEILTKADGTINKLSVHYLTPSLYPIVRLRIIE